MTYNASERKVIRKAEKEAKLAVLAEREFITGVMSTIPGRAWVHAKLSTCHVFATSFTGDPLTSAFAEGQRNIGLTIFNDILLACPDAYVLMMQEANAKELAHGRDTTAERSDDAELDGGDTIPGADSGGSGGYHADPVVDYSGYVDPANDPRPKQNGADTGRQDQT